MRIYNGSRPCQGCNVPGSEKSRSSVDSLCRDCQKLLILGKGVKEGPKGFSVIVINRNNFNRITMSSWNMFPSKFHDQTGSPPYVSDFGYAKTDIKGASNKEIADLIMSLCEKLECGEKPEYEYTIHMDDGRESFHIPTTAAIAIFELLKGFCLWGNAISDQRFKAGKNLLIGLNEGSITLQDFERRS